MKGKVLEWVWREWVYGIGRCALMPSWIVEKANKTIIYWEKNYSLGATFSPCKFIHMTTINHDSLPSVTLMGEGRAIIPSRRPGSSIHPAFLSTGLSTLLVCGTGLSTGIVCRLSLSVDPAWLLTWLDRWLSLTVDLARLSTQLFCRPNSSVNRACLLTLIVCRPCSSVNPACLLTRGYVQIIQC